MKSVSVFGQRPPKASDPLFHTGQFSISPFLGSGTEGADDPKKQADVLAPDVVAVQPLRIMLNICPLN